MLLWTHSWQRWSIPTQGAALSPSPTCGPRMHPAVSPKQNSMKKTSVGSATPGSEPRLHLSWLWNLRYVQPPLSLSVLTCKLGSGRVMHPEQGLATGELSFVREGGVPLSFLVTGLTSPITVPTRPVQLYPPDLTGVRAQMGSGAHQPYTWRVCPAVLQGHSS